MTAETVVEEAPVTGDDKIERETRRLTSAQWAEIRSLWELGEISLPELSKKYDISKNAISQWFKRHGVVKGSRAGEVVKAVEEKVKEEASTAIAEFTAERRRMISETKVEHYKYHRSLDQLLMSLVGKAVRDKESVAKYYPDIKAIRSVKAALAIGRSERYAVLDAQAEVDDRELPELRISELTDREVDDIRSHVDEDLDFSDLDLLDTKSSDIETGDDAT